MNIRLVTTADAASILSIYAYYVEHTAVTFEYEVPSLPAFEERIRTILCRYPYLATEDNGKILGYAYASAFKVRAAYDWSAETSIYIARDAHGKGIGKALYSQLEDYLTRQNICNLCACIAYPNPESIAFHEAFGYKTVAHFTSSGYKLGRWYDMIWMEKFINTHTNNPKPFIPFNRL